jgi:hypothetical protein
MPGYNRHVSQFVPQEELMGPRRAAIRAAGIEITRR